MLQPLVSMVRVPGPLSHACCTVKHVCLSHQLLQSESQAELSFLCEQQYYQWLLSYTALLLSGCTMLAGGIVADMVLTAGPHGEQHRVSGVLFWISASCWQLGCR